MNWAFPDARADYIAKRLRPAHGQVKLTDEEKAEIVRRIIQGPRPKNHALWLMDGKLYERVGISGPPNFLSWKQAAIRAGMVPEQPKFEKSLCIRRKRAAS